MANRLKALLGKLKLSRLDGFLLSAEANVSYVSGFKNSESYLLVSPYKSYFITDFRYAEEARLKVKGFRVYQYKDLFKDIASLAGQLKIRRLGFESKDLNFAEYTRIKHSLHKRVRLINTFGLVEGLRQVKDNNELALIRKAVDIAGNAFRFLKRHLKAGQTELEIAGDIERFIRYEGAGQSAFNVIVASGSNSSFPHPTISNRKIGKADLVLIDLGVSINGYKSDLTRVFFLDKIPSIQRKIYEIVAGAQAQAIEAIETSRQICQAHQTALNYISRGGYGRYFGHSLGHGIGLQTHEEPSVSASNKSSFLEGMVFTIEPGIYLPGRFGIRLEDMVLVKKKGLEILSGAINKSI